MNFARTLLSASSVVLLSHFIYAQELQYPYGIEPCATDRIQNDFLEDHPELADDIQNADKALDEWSEYVRKNEQELRAGGGPYIIPVVFHIIHLNGPENISAAQVQDAIRVLNEDFNGLNVDWGAVNAPFDTIKASVGIEFRLAQKDPNGVCHSGINRIFSNETNVGDNGMKALINWPRDQYLNIWVCINSDGAAGYATLPPFAHFSPSTDGIVINHNYVGAIGTSNYTRGRALTHEVGHWLNLHHLWGDGQVGTGCGDDDGIYDTPNCAGSTSGCSGNSCSNNSADDAYWGFEVDDNRQNFMEYTYCYRMFTNGQATEMISTLTSTSWNNADRRDLWQPSNLAATGTDGVGVLCVADFSANITVICPGDSVQFFDISYHAVTQRDWTFSGGSPSVSSDANPWVTYNTPGFYDVSLDVGDGVTNLTESKNSYILVLNNPGAPVPFSEGFEVAGTWPTVGWLDEDTIPSWYKTGTASYSGSTSLKLDNRLYDVGETSEFSSVTYDLSNATSVALTFRYAFKQTNGSNSDMLQVLATNNCGETWSVRKTIPVSFLVSSSGYTSTDWSPSGASEWLLGEVATITSSYFTSDFRFKFRMTSGGGNNIFIDDINLTAVVGIEEENHSVNLSIYPNPMEDESVIEFELLGSENVSLVVVDLLGQQVMSLINESISGGMHRVTIPATELASGVYFIKLTVNEQEITRKIVVK